MLCHGRGALMLCMKVRIATLLRISSWRTAPRRAGARVNGQGIHRKPTGHQVPAAEAPTRRPVSHQAVTHLSLITASQLARASQSQWAVSLAGV